LSETFVILRRTERDIIKKCVSVTENAEALVVVTKEIGLEVEGEMNEI
jgi:hypothetical protein